MADLSSWLTKRQAAEALEVSEKSIERYVKAKRLKSRMRRAPGQRPVVVYDPESIQSMKANRDQDELYEDVTPVEEVVGDAKALVKSTRHPAAPALQMPTNLPAALAALLAGLETGKTSVSIERRVFLTLTEAAHFSGLPASLLRQLISSGKLQAMKTGAGWRIPRSALELLPSLLAAGELDQTYQTH